MSDNNFPLLSDQEQLALKDALHYMKMLELKMACLMLALPYKEKKAALIERILTYVKEGRIIATPTIPIVSLAKNYPIQPLAPSSLMLYDGYKNDLKTRDFFKKLIGLYFHFTAYGIDWLNKRWLNGNPPTYQEFADFWKQEFVKRKKEKPKPKDEWMYIRFMQKMEKLEPDAGKEDLMHAWKMVQAKKKEEGFQLLDKAKKVLQ